MPAHSRTDRTDTRVLALLRALGRRPAQPRYFAANRSRRVIALLIAITGLGLLDLHFTLREARHTYFSEGNPIAAAVLESTPESVVWFKGSLLACGILILLTLRRRRPAEVAGWLVLTVHVALQLQWGLYYVILGPRDPTVIYDPRTDAWVALPQPSPMRGGAPLGRRMQPTGALPRDVVVAQAAFEPSSRWRESAGAEPPARPAGRHDAFLLWKAGPDRPLPPD